MIEPIEVGLDRRDHRMELPADRIEIMTRLVDVIVPLEQVKLLQESE